MTDRIRTGPASLASSRAEPLTLRSRGADDGTRPRSLPGELNPDRLRTGEACLPLPLGRHELGAQGSNLEVFASKARRVYRFPYRPLRAFAECHPRLAGLTRSARSWTRGPVRSAGLEPANTRTSSVPVCQLRHERKRAATRGRTGPSAVRRRSRKPCAAAELGYQASNLEKLPVQGRAGLPVPPYPIE